jgi:hypothetical protein
MLPPSAQWRNGPVASRDGPSFNLQLTVGGEGSSKEFVTLLLVGEAIRCKPDTPPALLIRRT